MTIGRVDINEKDLPKICGAIIQLEERIDSDEVPAAVTAAITDAIATSTSPQSGRLTYVNATTLKFVPCGGQIKINGVLYTIPTAGITIPNSPVNVGGTPGSSLASGTTYLIGLYNSGGTPTPIFWTGQAHFPDTTAGNEGVEVIANQNYTLIGMCITNASSQFVNSAAQRYVLSWFNRRNIGVQGTTTNGASTASVTVVELASAARAEFLTWADESVVIGLGGLSLNDTAGGINQPNVGIDGTGTTAFTHGPWAQVYVANAYVPHGGMATATMTEGYHYLTPIFLVSSGTATVYMQASALIRG